jgi:hypothetical protein
VLAAIAREVADQLGLFRWRGEDFVPRPADGEVQALELWSIADVVETVRKTDDFKFDLFRRRELIANV